MPDRRYAPALIEAIVAAARKRRLLDLPGLAAVQAALRALAPTRIEQVRQALHDGLGGAIGLHPGRQLAQTLAGAEQRQWSGYRPLVHLTDGGMGSLWLAADEESRLVVVKVLLKTLASSESFVRRFEREARVLASIDHPNVLRLLAVGRGDDGSMHLITEFLGGGDLQELAYGHGVSEGYALRLVAQAARGLDAVHRQGVIHRDIKPANLLIANDHRAVLGDFGVASADELDQGEVTIAGELLGSPQYMSPEQALGGSSVADARSDVYGLGGVLFFALTGREPYQGQTSELVEQQVHGPVPDAGALRADLAVSSRRVLGMCLAKDPAKRFASAAALADALDAALEVWQQHHPGVDPSDPGVRRVAGARLGEVSGTLAAVQTPVRQRVPKPSEVADVTARHPVLSDAPDAPKHESRRIPAGAVAVLRTPPLGVGSGAGLADGEEAAQRLAGDWSRGMGERWLALCDQHNPQRLVLLWAQTRLVLGKLRGPPVDVCVRCYTPERQLSFGQKISRQHAELVLDAERGAVLLEDLGSSNGTALDGKALRRDAPSTLRPGTDHAVLLAASVPLRVRVRQRSTPVLRRLEGALPSAGADCGLDAEVPIDAVSVHRVHDRPELCYGLVPRLIVLGAADDAAADLRLHGASGSEAAELGLYSGRWVWRPRQRGQPWRALASDDPISVAGCTLVARPATYDDFLDAQGSLSSQA